MKAFMIMCGTAGTMMYPEPREVAVRLFPAVLKVERMSSILIDKTLRGYVSLLMNSAFPCFKKSFSGLLLLF